MNEIKKKIEEKYNEIKIPQELEIAIQNSIQAINDSMSSIFPEEFKEGFIKLAEIGTRSAEHFDQISSIYKGHIEKLKTSVEIFKKEFPEALTGLAKHGWYFNYDIVPRLPAELYRKVKEKKIEEVDKILSEEYESNLGLIEKQIIQLNPNRTAIIREAFENHRQERYYSAITLLLTQVDGICRDEFEKLFFKNDPDARKNSIYKPEVEVELRKGADSLTELYLEVLKTSTGINDYSKNVCKYPDRLNRHEILHGMDYEYGTKLNSLKIISFISFINDIVRYGSDRKRSSRQLTMNNGQ